MSSGALNLLRVAIIGPGAIGGCIAAHLLRCEKLEVKLAARTFFETLSLELPDGSKLQYAPSLILPGETITKPYDWVLVTTKAYDVNGTISWLKSLVGSATRVAILQNGVEHCERFQNAVPRKQLLPVMVDLPASRTTAGVIQQRGRAILRVPDSSLGQSFITLFQGTDIDAETVKDFTTVIWRKLTLNAPGAINALLLKPNGIVRNPAVANLMRNIMLETISVARAEGAALEDSLADEILESMRQAPTDSINSLHADRIAGRTMEVDARNGAVVRAGRRHDISTPLNQMAVTLLESLATSQ